jgi:type II secretory pathway pseudopilin PulG
MNYKLRTKHGLTLTEMTVVIASIALLVAIGLPAVRAFIHSFETESSAKSAISAALSSARAIAAKEHRYAGIRFQKAYNRDAQDPLDPLTAPQYMIFIIYDPELPRSKQGNLGCKAVEGLKPIKLPDSVGVMDLTINADPQIDTPEGLRDTTTFSIVFSPSGKLIIHDLWVRNRDGVSDNSSKDDVFNTEINIRGNIGMFLQDDNSSPGLRIEPSRNNFIIYDTKEFTQAYKKGQAYSGYLYRLVPQAIYINPYTGTIISE